MFFIKMSFLSELKSRASKLRATETTITYADGSREHVTKQKKTLKLESRNFGFVVDTKPDHIPACIVDNFLYLGSQDAVSLSNIHSYGITDVLSVGIEIKALDLSSEKPIVRRHFVACLDLPETNLSAVVKHTNAIIEKVAQQRGVILVHCNAGVSRAASVCIGYLIMAKSMSFSSAYELVKSKRSSIQPNRGFMKQLKQMSN